ncbi:23S rRNA (uracil(1939)-C(5))-methyltransferase RlmD [Trichlorobacter lovleyi]|uniref:23S rRNA (uracil(1939)-C(5))-methyltransferase RlmD n=1 Tax=Trichlorobacter lovleyi TaxID=313985 RepID=UPI0024813CF1|nr:23S rRNA (uracil(1939)-C(5))-methyltransferase RlmD [Trichlorobacter lovleyi]
MSVDELVIERLALGGNGVGRIDGKVCFVPFSAPGDRLKVRVVREHRSYCEAELVELCEPSPQRVEPRCPAFGRCGGCDWQHISYQAQCDAKQQILIETLQRVAHLQAPAVASTAASGLDYGYRARAQFKLHATPAGLAVGFFRRGSRYVIDLPQGCPICTEPINTAMLKLRQVIQAVPDLHRIPQLSLEEGASGVVAVVHYIGSDQQRLKQLLLQHRDQLGVSGLFLQIGRKEALQPVFGSGHLTYPVPRCDLSADAMSLGYEIGGFSQVNRLQNQKMVKLVCGYAQPAASQRMLDLYCGNGNLSLPLSGAVQELLGIEGFAPSIASAVDNARQLRVNNSTFRCNDASKELRHLIAQHAVFDLVLLDPPRAGAADVARQLAQLGAQRIVYVSCDPATLARDLAVLCGAAGYRLIEATPLDMFPQTGHLETVALLTRT